MSTQRRVLPAIPAESAEGGWAGVSGTWCQQSFSAASLVRNLTSQTHDLTAEMSPAQADNAQPIPCGWSNNARLPLRARRSASRIHIPGTNEHIRSNDTHSSLGSLPHAGISKGNWPVVTGWGQAHSSPGLLVTIGLADWCQCRVARTRVVNDYLDCTSSVASSWGWPYSSVLYRRQNGRPTRLVRLLLFLSQIYCTRV